MEKRVWIRSLAILMMGLLILGIIAVSIGVEATTFAQQPQPTATLDAEGYIERGSAFVQRGQYEEAIEELNEAIRMDPEAADAYFIRALAYEALGEYERAISDYTRTIELTPEFAYAYYARGNSYYALGEYEQAIADYDRAIMLEIELDCGCVYNNRGWSHLQLGQREQALADFDQAIALDPDLAGAYAGRGHVYYELEDFPAALADFHTYEELTGELDPVMEERIEAMEATSESGWIVFANDSYSAFDVFKISPAGGNSFRLTDDPGEDITPAWSPDRQRIAFASDRDGDFDIYVMNADGSSPRNLNQNSAFDGFPTWSPDGQRIAFQSEMSGGSDIYVMNADGTNVTRLTDDSNSAGPIWSPDGRRIAFARYDPGTENTDIYVMNADGSDVIQLTDDPATEMPGDWSPDGSRLAFTRERDGNDDIYLMDADGSHVIQFTDHPKYDSSPSWSPDGSQLVFVSNRDAGKTVMGAQDLYVMSADGSNVRHLFGNAIEAQVQLDDGVMSMDLINENSPDWQPNAVAVTSAERPVLVIGVTGTYFRETPALDAPTEAVSNARLPIVGISEDGEWYQVEYEGRTGWVRDSAMIQVEGDLGTVDVIEQEIPAGPVLVIGFMGVYLRDAPTPNAPFEGVFHERLPIIGISEDGLWYQVEYEGRTGWVRASSPARVEGDLEGVPVVQAGEVAPAEGPVLVIGFTGAYLREAPTFDAPSEAVSNERLPIVGISEDGEWYQVEYEGRTGWVRASSSVRAEGDLGGVPVIETVEPGTTPYVKIGASDIWVFAEPDTGSEVIASVANAELPIIGRAADGDWYQVEVEGKVGWLPAATFFWNQVVGDREDVPVVESAAAPVAQTTTYYIISSTANARACASTTCARVTTFAYGETLEVIGTVEGEYTLGSSEWREVLYQDQVVYVHSSLTSLSEPTAPPEATPGSSSTTLITIGNQPDWVDSGIAVSAGQSFTVEAQGLMNPCLATDPNGAEYCVFYGPGGAEGVLTQHNEFGIFPALGQRFMVLLGRIGDGGPFYVGAGGTFTAEQAGTLWFTPNDNLRTDNQGAFTVQITVH